MAEYNHRGALEKPQEPQSHRGPEKPPFSRALVSSLLSLLRMHRARGCRDTLGPRHRRVLRPASLGELAFPGASALGGVWDLLHPPLPR